MEQYFGLHTFFPYFAGIVFKVVFCIFDACGKWLTKDKCKHHDRFGVTIEKASRTAKMVKPVIVVVF